MGDVNVWAERLVNVWIRMRQGLNKPEEEITDAQHLQWFDIKMEFDAMVVDIGMEGLLNDTCQVIFAELLNDVTIDDDELDVETQFHRDLFFALSHRFHDVDDDSQDEHKLAAVSEVMAIPMFGDRHILDEMIWKPGFTEQLRQNGLIHDNSNAVLLGLIPVDRAQHHLIEPQALFELHNGSSSVVVDTDYLTSEAGHQELERIKQAFGVDQFPKERKEGTQVFGAYLAVYATVSMAEQLDELVHSTIEDYTEETLDKWNDNLKTWCASQDNSEALQRQNISHPLLYRDAVAFAMADFAMHNMFLQHSIGGNENDTISRFEVVVPDDADEGISLDDVVQIIGYSQDNELMGTVQYNAVAAAFVHDEMETCWDQWLGARTDVVLRQNFSALRQRRLH